MFHENSNDTVTRSFCRECGRPIVGRPDKLYCSDTCRWRSYNARVAVLTKRHAPVLEAMDANYMVLERMIAQKRQSVGLIELKTMGFDPSFITWTVRRSHMVCRCFDIEYCLSRNKVFNIHTISNPLEELFPPEDMK